MEAPCVRDEVLEQFRATWKARVHSAVQPLKDLPNPKGIISDLLLSVVSDDRSQLDSVQSDLWHLARFQKLDADETSLVEHAERSRAFPGGSAQSYPAFAELQRLNGRFHPIIEQERADYRAALFDKLKGAD